MICNIYDIGAYRPIMCLRKTYQNWFSCIKVMLCVGGVFIGCGVNADVPTSIKPVSIGLSGFAYWSSGPFANTLQSGAEWLEYDTNFGSPVFFQNTDGTINPQFNSNGLPKYLNPDQRLRILFWPFSAQTEGEPNRGISGVGKWVVTWQGDADIRLSTGTLISAESSGEPSGKGSILNGRRVYRMSALQSRSSGHLRIEAINAASPLTDLKVWLPDPADPENSSLENSGSMWHPSLVARIASADFNHLRFMDWGSTNQSPQQDWIDRRLPTFALQSGVLHRRSPADGVIYYTDEVGTPHYFTGDRPTGVAFEHMVALCNATGKDMWICVPHLATDDFVVKLANLIAFGSDGVNPYSSVTASPVHPPLDSSLKVWVEYSNEIWSRGNSFPQGNWAQAQADSLGISKAQFNARRYSQIWQIFQQRFGGSSRIVRSAGIWTGGSSYTSAFLNELHSYGPTLTPAVSPDIISPTTYFGNGIQDWVYEQANLTRGTTKQWFHTSADFVYNTSTGATRPVSVPLNAPYWQSPELTSQQDATFTEWKKRIFSGSTARGGGPDSTGMGGGFNASLRTDIFSVFGVNLPIVAYEGGPSLYVDYYDGGNLQDNGITNFIVDINRQPGFAEIYRIQLNMARAKGLDSHSLFVDVSRWGKYGQWGHLEYQGQPLEESVKWSAVQAWRSDMAGIRSVNEVMGSRPIFSTVGTLPVGNYRALYSQDIVVTGGDVASGSALQFSVIGSQADEGFTLAPVVGDPRRFRISGTPETSGWNYFYVRVSDDDGDSSWQIYSFYIAGGLGTLVELDMRGDFLGSSSLPWTLTHVLDPAITWSGIDIGMSYGNTGGTATGTDGVGVRVYPETNGLGFSVDQGAGSASDSTLASAISDQEYLKFTVTPKVGKALDLRQAEFQIAWDRSRYHAPRSFSVMSSVDGFTEGAPLYSLTTMPEMGARAEHVFQLPNTPSYQNLTGPVEFRIYFHGSQYGHQARFLGLKLSRHSISYSTWADQIDWQGSNPSEMTDANGDGVLNFLAFALDLDPLVNLKINDLPHVSLDRTLAAGPWMIFTYRKNSLALGLNYQLQWSSTLAEGSWVDLSVDDLSIFEEVLDTDPDGDDSSQLLQMRVKYDPSVSPQQFLRLKVSF